MEHETDPRPDATPDAEEPANWDRNEMKADFGEDGEPSKPDAGSESPGWNEGQMARERPDGTREAKPSDEEISESKGGLSGGGANPGGGEKFAERDAE